MTTWLTDTARRGRRRLRSSFGDLSEDERGDIPGWVLVTLMTAAIVVAIWLLAEPALSGLFQDAMERVTGM